MARATDVEKENLQYDDGLGLEVDDDTAHQISHGNPIPAKPIALLTVK